MPTALTAFTASLLLITISELGDKTFFIAMVLSMRHPRKLVLFGVIAALATMTILSVMFGQALAFLPKNYLKYAEIFFFLAFGLKLLYDAWKMPFHTEDDIQQEALEAVTEKENKMKSHQMFAILWEIFTLTFLAEWGDRTQITTIALASSYNAVMVTLGAILGHSICAFIAVLGGKLIAGRISEKQITAIGGILFLIFAAVAAIEFL